MGCGGQGDAGGLSRMWPPVFVNTTDGWSVFRPLGHLSPLSVASQNPQFTKIVCFIYFAGGGLCLLWLNLKFSEPVNRTLLRVLYLAFGTLLAMFCLLSAAALLLKGAVVYSKARHGTILSKQDD